MAGDHGLTALAPEFGATEVLPNGKGWTVTRDRVTDMEVFTRPDGRSYVRCHRPGDAPDVRIAAKSRGMPDTLLVLIGRSPLHRRRATAAKRAARAQKARGY